MRRNPQELDYVKNQFNEKTVQRIGKLKPTKRAFNEKAWQEFYLTVEKTIKQEIEEREKIHKEKEETVGMYKQYFAELTVERNVNKETIEYLKRSVERKHNLIQWKNGRVRYFKSRVG